MIIKKYQHPFYQHIGELGDVVVNPLLIKLGIAKKLIDECKKHAKINSIQII